MIGRITPVDIRYNIIQYLQNNTGFAYLVDMFVEDSPAESMALRAGISIDSNGQTIRYPVEIVSRSDSRLKAQQNLFVVYGLLINKCGLLLPETTVDSVVYPETRVDQIIEALPLQFMRADENQLFLWNVSFHFIYGGI